MDCGGQRKDGSEGFTKEVGLKKGGTHRDYRRSDGPQAGFGKHALIC